MRHTRLEDSEVFNAFADIAVKEGLLKKEAEYLYPDFDISQKSPELDIKVAGDKRTELYDVTGETGEDLINKAHPGGGVVADASGSGDYGKVETILEEQKKNRDIAESVPTGKLAALMAHLVALADELDAAGFEVLAQELDDEMQKLAIDPLHRKPQQGYAELPEGALDMPAPQSLQPGSRDPRLDPKLQQYMLGKQKAKQLAQQKAQQQQQAQQYAELPENALKMPAPQALQTGTKPPMGPPR